MQTNPSRPQILVLNGRHLDGGLARGAGVGPRAQDGRDFGEGPIVGLGRDVEQVAHELIDFCHVEARQLEASLHLCKVEG